MILSQDGQSCTSRACTFVTHAVQIEVRATALVSFCNASLQALGILVQVEGAKYGRRVPAVLPLLASSLQKGVQSMEEEQELSQQDAEDESSGRLPGWQEVYACLLFLERLANTTPTQVSLP